MAIAKLTAREISGLSEGTYYDADLTGFGLRIGKHGGTWFIEYRPGAGGRTVPKTRVKLGRLDHLTPDEARKLAKKELGAVAGGIDPARARAAERAALPFARIAAEYLERHVKAKRKAATEGSYERIIRLHLTPHIGAKKMSAISRQDVMAMHSAIGKDAGRYVANRALALVSSIFVWADPDGPNPARKIERFKEESRERYLSAEEMTRLGDALREAETTGFAVETKGAKHSPVGQTIVFGPHVTGAIRLLILTGARLREILNLRWDEVDKQRGLLLLPDSKTGRKTIVLSDAALEVIKSLPEVGAYVIAGRNAATDDEAPRSDLKRPWGAISKRAGIQDVRLHDLRHSFAATGVDSGMSLPVIGNLLGHKSTATTARYAHVDTNPARRAANEIAGRISKAIKK